MVHADQIVLIQQICSGLHISVEDYKGLAGYSALHLQLELAVKMINNSNKDKLGQSREWTHNRNTKPGQMSCVVISKLCQPP